jgi:hypothetical protein
LDSVGSGLFLSAIEWYWKKAKQREESSSSKVLPPAGEDDELHRKGQKLQKSLLLLAQSITSNFQE